MTMTDPLCVRVNVRVPFLAILLGLVLVVAAGCSQARCAWDNAKAQAQETFQDPCCPDECGNVWTKPIYEPCGGGAAPEIGRDRGAFSIARSKPAGA